MKLLETQNITELEQTLKEFEARGEDTTEVKRALEYRKMRQAVKTNHLNLALEKI